MISQSHKLTANHQHLQWFDWWTPLAGNDLHEFKAAVVELNVRGIVVLCVDLTCPQRTTVLRLNVDKRQTNVKPEIQQHENINHIQR